MFLTIPLPTLRTQLGDVDEYMYVMAYTTISRMCAYNSKILPSNILVVMGPEKRLDIRDNVMDVDRCSHSYGQISITLWLLHILTHFTSLDLLQTVSVSRDGIDQSVRYPDGSENRPRGGAPVNLCVHGRLQRIAPTARAHASQTPNYVTCVSTTFYLFKKPKTFKRIALWVGVSSHKRTKNK